MEFGSRAVEAFETLGQGATEARVLLAVRRAGKQRPPLIGGEALQHVGDIDDENESFVRGC